ncbi:Rieske (2Fe-2S) protein [Acrocarpospora catenulata]|uniref:Rieske (2Fe-2S) protein n=1 Tax=Acrocarpospora catenulata TaxID=2836182 RepID=UPI0027DFC246|nr:Rieske (2Fe-2S) protein [Acrocarpospora catenulata]
MEQNVTRRHVLGAAALAGAGAAMAACAATTEPATEATAAPAPGAALTTTAEVPVGGGVILSNVVVTQPESGTFKGFSPTCTHQGCAVTTITNKEIICPCHNSRFSITDGSVTSGPATSPLAEVSVKVDGDKITLA